MFEVIPSDRDSRWQLLEMFIAGWNRPLSCDGVSDEVLDEAQRRLGIDLPASLVEWYALAGRRADLWSCQDRFLQPEDLVIQNGALILLVENRFVHRWGIQVDHLGLVDPPVAIDSRSGWVEQNGTFSEFALELAVYAAKFWDVPEFCWANGQVTPQTVRLIEQNYSRFGFPDWYWPAYPTRFFGDEDVILETNGPATSNSWLWVCARNKDAFDRVERLLDAVEVRWEVAWNE